MTTRPRGIHGVLAAALTTLSLAACAGPPDYSEAEAGVIESRSADAPLDETFDAALTALFDTGYAIIMSDRQGGYITATRVKKPDEGWDAFWGGGPYFRSLAVMVQVRPDGPDHSLVRIKTQVGGQPWIDKDAIDEILRYMQLHVMMSAPSGGEASE